MEANDGDSVGDLAHLTLNIDRFYTDFHNEAFVWFLSPVPVIMELVQDTIDVLRVLRCADALR